MALSTAALPSLSTLAARGAKDELAKTWAHGFSLAMFVALPASALLVAVGEPLVVTIFQRGEFDAVAAHETARALLWQGGAIWTVAAVRQTVPALYALGDTRSPVIVSGLDLLAFIGLALWLRGPMGHVGVSVAVAGSSAVQMVLLLVALKARLGRLEGRAIAASVARTTVASAVAAAGGWGAARLAAPGRLLPGLAGLAAFGVLYVAVARALRAPELEEILGAVRRRLRKKKP